MISRSSNRGGDPQAGESARALPNPPPAPQRRQGAGRVGLLLGLFVAGLAVAAWQREARDAGPVRRRTTLRLQRRPG